MVLTFVLIFKPSGLFGQSDGGPSMTATTRNARPTARPGPVPAGHVCGTAPMPIARSRSSSAMAIDRPSCMYFLPLVPPLSVVQPPAPWYDSFANAGVFVLLAMG